MNGSETLNAARPFAYPLLSCENGHAYRTALPASFDGTPCRECGRPLTRCSGAKDCSAPLHLHGCFADYGNCDEPGEHERYAGGAS